MNLSYSKEDLKNQRIQNSARNGILSIVGNILAIGGAFLFRTLVGRCLEQQYLGLNSLFGSLSQLISMAEMGIGSVIVFFLYEPLAKGELERVQAILGYLKKLYRIIAVIMCVAVIIVIPFLRKMTGDDIRPDTPVELLFLIYMLSGILTYMVYPEVTIILNALQRVDVQNVINVAAMIACYSLQLAAVILFHSYLLYVVSFLFQLIVIGILRKRCQEKFFRDFRPVGNLDRESKRKIRGHVGAMVGHQIDDKVLSSVDTVLVTSFLGLTAATSYSNYFYVITAVTAFLEIVYSSILPSIGNALVTETEEGNLRRFRATFFLNAFLAGWATTEMLCLYQPFMKIWMPDYMLGNPTVLLFCVLFYIMQIRKTGLTFKNAAGLWQEDIVKPYLAMAVNLTLDLLMIWRMGIAGALISSIVSLFLIELPWESKVLFQNCFRRNPLRYLVSGVGYTGFNMVLCAISYIICCRITFTSGILAMILKFLISSALFVGGYLIVFRRSENLRIWVESIRLIRKK